MKKISTYLIFLLCIGLAKAQVTSNVLFDEDFSSALDNSLYIGNGGSFIFQSNSNGFDGDPGILEFQVMSSNSFGFETLSWRTSNTSSMADSIVIDLKIDKNYGFVSTFFQSGNSLTATGFDGVSGSYNATSFNVNIDETISIPFSSVADSTTFFQAKQVITSGLDQDLTLYEMQIIYNYSLTPSAGPSYFGADAFTVASEFCNSEFPGDANCVLDVENQIILAPRSYKIDDILITEYSSPVTGIEDEINTKKEVIAVYDLLGNPSSLEETNQPLVIQYSDGTTERLFNVK